MNKREKYERKALAIENKRLAGDKTYKDDPTGEEAVQNTMRPIVNDNNGNFR